MFQAFVITLREGLEAFLIVAITFAYLEKTKRNQLLPAVRWGIAASVLLSLGVAVLFRRASNHALWEGILALVAAVLVISLTVHMWRVGQHIKGDIETRLEMAAGRTGARAWIGVFAFTLLSDHSRRDGNGSPARRSSLPGAIRGRNYWGVCRYSLCCCNRRALGTLRASRKPRPFLSSECSVPVGVFSATPNLWIS
jgi:hypothetical protein